MACCLVHSFCCGVTPLRVSVCVGAWGLGCFVGWLVGLRGGWGVLPVGWLVSARGGCLFVRGCVGFGWWCARCFVCAWGLFVYLWRVCGLVCMAVEGFVDVGCVVGVGCVSFGGARG